ncbi:hypothetical protein AAMO2058_000708100 [Amorphochlora amoebiformis]
MLLIGTAGVGAVLGLVAFLVGFKTVGLYLFVGMGSIVLVLIVVAGYFTYPEVSVVERTPTFPLVYKPYTGPISQIGKAFMTLNKAIDKNAKIKQRNRMVALYYDSPGEVPDDKLRWCVGVVEEDIGANVKEALFKAGFKKAVIPGRKAVGTQWSFRPFLGILSIYFMVNRAYPEMERFCKKMKLDAGGHAMEFYSTCRYDSFGTKVTPVYVYLALDKNAWNIPEFPPRA